MTRELIAVLAAAAFLGACTTDPYTGEQKVSNTAGGAALGAGLGALAGMAVGGSSVAQRNAVLIGAGVGALAGGAIGATMDKNEAELRAQLQGTGVSVTRVGDRVVLNMPSDITFGVDQDTVQLELLPGAELGGDRAQPLPADGGRRVRLHGQHRRRQLQSRTVAAPRAVGRQLPQRAGRRFAPLRGHRLRRDAADRVERHRGRPRAEPPRRDPAVAADPLDSDRTETKKRPREGPFLMSWRCAEVSRSDLAGDLHEGRHVVAEADRAVIVVLPVAVRGVVALRLVVAARSRRALVAARPA